ncbi:hypothetical protein [Trinickia fusca]|nr:hypothetical protein [Trinickia fusca]
MSSARLSEGAIAGASFDDEAADDVFVSACARWADRLGDAFELVLP